MRTMNIFKGLALAMLMPAMLLTTACSNEDDAINEKVSQEGYKMPVTVNVTRQGDAATRATYDKTNKTLSFSEDDKLFVEGITLDGDNYYQYAGTLEWQSGGTFSGELDVNGSYPGTVEEMLTNATSVKATLLPRNCDYYGFLSIGGTGYNASLHDPNYDKAVAGDLATAIEQFSLEQATSYSGGFALAPQNAFVNCTLKVPETNSSTESSPYLLEIESGIKYGYLGQINFDNNSQIKFAIAVPSVSGLWKIQDASKKFSDIPFGEKTFVAGHIYNYTNIPTGHDLTSAAVGEIICSDGKAYPGTAYNILPTGVTALAKVVYMGGDAETNTTYNHGLALALEDASTGEKWCSKTYETCNIQYNNETAAKGDMAGIANTDALVNHTSHTHAAASAARNYNSGVHPTNTSAWFLPSAGQWNKIFYTIGYNALCNGFSSVGGSNMVTNSGYWTSSESSDFYAWYFKNYGAWEDSGSKNSDQNQYRVRAAIAF